MMTINKKVIKFIWVNTVLPYDNQNQGKVATSVLSDVRAKAKALIG